MSDPSPAAAVRDRGARERTPVPAAALPVLALLCFLFASCAGAAPAGAFLLKLDAATFDRGEPVSAAPQRLPFVWRLPPAGAGAAVFSFAVPDRHADLAIFVETTYLNFSARLNGEEVFRTVGEHPSGVAAPRGWKMSPTFQLPDNVLRTGVNVLELRFVRGDGDAYGGLGPVWVGDVNEVGRLDTWHMVRDTIAPMVIAAVILTLGLFTLVLARGQADRTMFVLFGVGALVWGVHTAVALLPVRVLPQPHYGAIFSAAYCWFALPLCVFCVRFARLRWTAFERAAGLVAVAALPAMYLGNAVGAAAIVSTTLRTLCLAFVAVALGGVVRYAVASRSLDAWLLLGAGLVTAALSLYEFVLAERGVLLKAILVPYGGLAFIALAGWMLIERYQRTSEALEELNRTLGRRIADANAELVRQLAEVRAAREVAEGASVAKSKFFAAASHDLRQPLHALGMFAAALDSHVATDEGRELRRRIGAMVEALESLFDELLDLSRLDAGAIEAQVQPVALRDLFDRLELRFAREAQERQLRLRFVPTGRCVRSDPLLLERIVSNLVANALRYTERGGVLVGARRCGERIALEVRDSGIGIAAGEQQRIFDEFYQTNNPARDRRKGLGLGLAIVRRLVELLGHRLELVSAPGRGSVFRLVLPSAAATRAPASRALPVAASPMQGRRVLVVDDEIEIRDASVALLTQWGVQVLVAADPSELACVLDAEPRPDAAIVDLRLGKDFDGVDVIAALRARIGERFPALLISGDTGARELARVQASGVPLLIKPVPPAKMRAALHACLARSA